MLNMPVEYIVALYRIALSKTANVWPDETKNRSGLNIDSRGGLGYIHIRRYIFIPPSTENWGSRPIECDDYTAIQTILRKVIENI